MKVKYNKNDTIAVLGCGWLGLPLALKLKQSGYYVNGATTTLAKKEIIAANGIEPFLVQLGSEIKGDDINLFLNADVLIINIPPGRNSNNADSYLEKMTLLYQAIKKSTVRKVIFVSSSSVYTEIGDFVTETSIVDNKSEKGLRLYNAEQIFKNDYDLQTTIIRMAGLIGPQRHPGRFFAGKSDISDGLVPVNLIHLDDCIGIIEAVIHQQYWNETLNGCAPDHPLKKDFYQLASQQLYGKNAEFLHEKGAFKIVDGNKVIRELNYQFKIKKLMEWLLQTPAN